MYANISAFISYYQNYVVFSYNPVWSFSFLTLKKNKYFSSLNSSPFGLIYFLSALWILSDDSAAKYAFLASCKPVRCPFIVSLIVLFSRAGGLLIILDGKFGFQPYTI